MCTPMSDENAYVCPNGHEVARMFVVPCGECGALVTCQPAAVGMELHRQIEALERLLHNERAKSPEIDVAKVRELVELVLSASDVNVPAEHVAYVLAILDMHYLLRGFSDHTAAEYHERVQRASAEALRRLFPEGDQ